MENLYISKRTLSMKNLAVNAGLKTFYMNPQNKNEIIVDARESFKYCELNTMNRLEYLYQLWERYIICNINIPMRKVYIDDEYIGYTLKMINDLYDFENIITSDVMKTSNKLELLKRFDDIVQNMHEIGIVSFDLNPTNLVLDDKCNPHIIDVIDGQFGPFTASCFDRRLELLYQKSFFGNKFSSHIDNVIMHFNLINALSGNNQIEIFDIKEYPGLIKKLKVPTSVKKLLKQMGDFDSIENIPCVSETIKQIL